MAKRGRPKRDPDSYWRFVVTFWLIYGEDDDLITELRDVPTGNRMKRIKELMRSGGASISSMFKVGEDDDLLAEIIGLDDSERMRRIKQLMRQGLETEEADDDQTDDEKALVGLLDL